MKHEYVSLPFVKKDHVIYVFQTGVAEQVNAVIHG